ncbi:serine/threonine protein kinase [Ovoidimarina sediminis]|uniref:serine/threonine protein kinase n=1 Tax=Ovoidimarina sediminis TaxID=3079856 RepID=UPI002912127B|nr:serine/threonine protein kinase [Rhodophyticola sp. MJ-SS7]MDU8943811.1 serine/threonine protein kinase [Rhodophyticola sp. MJ-SS7]
MTGPEDTFVATSVLKRDAFSETVMGHAPGRPEEKLTRRNLGTLPLWSRGIGRALARREARALEAVIGIDGVPQLVTSSRDGLTRSWMEGTPLQLARPSGPEWYKDAARLLKEMHARGVTHNDLAKPQNWLALPDGRAGVIDFQLAILHRRRGRFYEIGVYEDERHLLKQKQRFAPDLLTAAEREILETRSRLSEIWRATGKRAYNFVTRRVLNWSDGEGTGDRLELEGPAIRTALLDGGGVREVEIMTFSAAASRIGLYAFVETDLSADALRSRVKALRLDHLQTASALPRGDGGAVRRDVLALVASNRMDEIEALLDREPELREIVSPLVGARENLTDRYIR